ncbi:MAG TPA: 2-oxo-4-hydroxy-4-carboxy-5-ureidoimidazoline decarboxylase [Steroidobacteraceae bacterium]|nr:2-oxo-4-hydroxy-4-carboxy-5-ureidoimidazoline decarboxylase [Steroidobacteraceae bacterium]
MITLEQLNALAAGQFVATLGVVFEHSPWVAERAAAQRPFASRLQLLDTMRAAVDDATPAQQLALIRAHPKLGTRGRSASPLTVASAGEQRRAGLAACTPADGVRLEQLNALYLERFGFPFILAVRGHDPASIIANLERRLSSDIESERQAALSQIGAIAAYRLADMIASPPGPEIVAMLERLLRSSTASGMVREWMQAAGLEVWPAPGSAAIGSHLLLGLARGGEPTAKTLLAGVCRDALMNALRYQGRAAFIIAIEVAQQLRHQGARPAFALAVLARPDAAGPGNTGGLPDGHAPQIWVELGPADAADAQGTEMLRTLRMAQLGAAVTLVRQGCASGGQGAAALDAAAAGRAALALEQSLRGVQTAAHG